MKQSLRELLDPDVGPEQAREQAVAVTLLFEEVLRGGREHVTNFLDSNNIVLAIHALQGRFRPDLAGLSLLYQRVARELFGVRRTRAWLFRFVEIEATGGPRSFCYHLGWTVSRGGLHGLVPRLAAQLASEDRDERMAAAYLIADAAAFFSHSSHCCSGAQPRQADRRSVTRRSRTWLRSRRAAGLQPRSRPRTWRTSSSSSTTTAAAAAAAAGARADARPALGAGATKRARPGRGTAGAALDLAG